MEKRHARRRQCGAAATNQQSEEETISPRETDAKSIEDYKVKKKRFEDKDRRSVRRTAYANLTEEEKERKRAKGRHLYNKLTDEQKAMRRVRQKEFRKRRSYTVLPEEEKEKRRAYYRHYYRDKLTDEQKQRIKAVRSANRKRKIASGRIKSFADLPEEEKEKRRALRRQQEALMTKDERERRKTYKREQWRRLYAKLPEEEKEKIRAKQRRRRAALTDEDRVRLNAAQQAYRKRRIAAGRLKEKQLESKNIPLRECSVKLVRGEIDDNSYCTSGCIKSSNIIDEQCETSVAVKTEECTSLIGELDYFEECEDWKTHIKTESNDEE